MSINNCKVLWILKRMLEETKGIGYTSKHLRYINKAWKLPKCQPSNWQCTSYICQSFLEVCTSGWCTFGNLQSFHLWSPSPWLLSSSISGMRQTQNRTIWTSSVAIRCSQSLYLYEQLVDSSYAWPAIHCIKIFNGIKILCYVW